MRRVFVSLVLLVATVALVKADPHNLEGGALITHNSGYGGRYWPNCETYFQYNPIWSCEEQNTTIQTSAYVGVTWFVVAAFGEDKEWCGVQFGFDDFDPHIMEFMDAEPCYPPGGGLEIPSPGWPGPLAGTAIISTGAPWEGNWIPVYAFMVYAYGYYGSGVVQLIPDPTVPVPFGGFSNCSVPPEPYDAALGGMGVNHPGTWVCWGWEDFVCCIGQDCVIVHSEDECTELGGQFHPEWDNCGPPNPCIVTPTTTTRWGDIKTMYR